MCTNISTEEINVKIIALLEYSIGHIMCFPQIKGKVVKFILVSHKEKNYVLINNHY